VTHIADPQARFWVYRAGLSSLGCESASNRDPLPIGANTFIQCHYQRFGGVPIGADQDPPVQRILDIESRW